MSRNHWAGYFDRVYCINLSRRPDRWRRFRAGVPADWRFARIRRSPAIDGLRCPPPPRWSASPGAWGCYQSHLRLIEDALSRGLQSLLVFEDDAVFCRDFSRRACAFLSAVPGDWEMLYLGGQLVKAELFPPALINRRVQWPYHVTRLHAYAVHGRMLPMLYAHLISSAADCGRYVDHRIGELHETRQHRVYCPRQWLVGQAAGRSDISGRTMPERDWNPTALPRGRPRRT